MGERKKRSKTTTSCEVHGLVLERMQVRVIYGLPVNDNSFTELTKSRQDLFPNAKTHVLGGCRLGAIGSHIEDLVCPGCRAAEQEWEKANNRKAEPEINGLLLGRKA